MNCILLVFFYTIINILLVNSKSYVKNDMFRSQEERNHLVKVCDMLHCGTTVIVFGQIIRLGY